MDWIFSVLEAKKRWQKSNPPKITLKVQRRKKTIHSSLNIVTNKMRELFSKIDIHAPVAKVWQTLTDFPAFPTWNTFIPLIKGEARSGSRLRIHVHTPAGKQLIFRPVVLKAEPFSELRWLGTLWGLGGLFRGEHYFRLEPLEKDSAKFIQGEKFNGLLLPLIWKILREDLELGFWEFNKALKKECETDG